MAVDFDGPQSIVEHSRDAAVVILPLRIRGRRLLGLKGQHLASVLPELPVTAMALAAEDIDLSAEPDSDASVEPTEGSTNAAEAAGFKSPD